MLPYSNRFSAPQLDYAVKGEAWWSFVFRHF